MDMASKAAVSCASDARITAGRNGERANVRIRAAACSNPPGISAAANCRMRGLRRRRSRADVMTPSVPSLPSTRWRRSGPVDAAGNPPTSQVPTGVARRAEISMSSIRP